MTTSPLPWIALGILLATVLEPVVRIAFRIEFDLATRRKQCNNHSKAREPETGE